MESIENKNVEAVKRFIEVQIRPGKKYDYNGLQQRFNNALTKKENASLRGYRLTLEMINKSYLRISLGKDCDISDWYIEKLREFIAKYRKIRATLGSIQPGAYVTPNGVKVVWKLLPKEQLNNPTKKQTLVIKNAPIKPKTILKPVVESKIYWQNTPYHSKFKRNIYGYSKNLWKLEDDVWKSYRNEILTGKLGKVNPPIDAGYTHVKLKEVKGTKIVSSEWQDESISSYFTKGSGRGRWGSGPRIMMRGHYSPQKVPIDEFGCVVVCDSDNE